MKRSNRNLLLLALASAVSFCGCVFFSIQEEGGALCINEALASSYSMFLTGNEERAEWIELYNGTEDSISLEGYGLSNDPDSPFLWTFPDVSIGSGEFLVVYAGRSSLPSEGDGELHTNFRLSSRGGVLTLTAPGGAVADRFEYDAAYTNVPYGRSPDGGRPALLNAATPGRTNVTSPVSRYIAGDFTDERPAFSHASGFYDEPFDLSITVPEGASVYYTLDGSEPDLSSRRYTGPIRVEDPSAQPNRYADVRTSARLHFLSAYGQESVEKAVTVRARVFQNGRFSKNTASATYFVGREQSLTTVSLICDPDDLFGYENGIYVAGKIGAARTHTKEQTLDGLIGYNILGNYVITGEEAARRVHIEIFPKDSGRTVSQNGEVRTSGGRNASARADKSLRLYATSKYGDGSVFEIPFFSRTETEKEEFSQLVLRADEKLVAGVLQDAFSATAFLGDGLCVQAYEPVTLYINGEYWGVAAMRERVDTAMIADHYGVDEDSIVLLKSAHEASQQLDKFADDPAMLEFIQTAKHSGKMMLQSGSEQDMEEYLALYEFAACHDLSEEANYRYIEEQVDLDSFIRNYIAHIFFACRDWPDNNIRAFRTSVREEGNPYSDGKWRFILFDMDYSCEDYAHNTLLYAMGRGEREYGWEGNETPPEWSTSLFAGLMENQAFRDRFLEIYQEYRADTFQPQTLLAEFDAFLEELGDNVERHESRWTLKKTSLGKIFGASEGILGPEEDSGAVIESMRLFFQYRLSYMDRYMEAFYAEKGDSIVWE